VPGGRLDEPGHAGRRRRLQPGPLRRGADPEAADVIFTLASPEVHLLLTAERGWSPGQWLD
jgi:hypothetical protein